MNQLFAEQAGIVFWEISGDVDWRQANREHLQEFAELIARECINAVYDIDDFGDYHFKAADAVKQHFGIEE